VVSGERSIPEKLRLPGPGAVDGELLTTLFVVNSPLRRLPGMPRPPATCVTFTLSGWRIPSLRCMRRSPPEREGQQLKLLLPAVQCGRSLRLRNQNSPGNPAHRGAAAQDPVQGSPERSLRAGATAAYRRRSGYLRPLRGILPHLERQTARRPAVRRSASKLKIRWIWCPAAPAMACGCGEAFRQVGPLWHHGLTNVSVGRHPGAHRAPDGCGAQGFSSPAQTRPGSRSAILCCARPQGSSC